MTPETNYQNFMSDAESVIGHEPPKHIDDMQRALHAKGYMLVFTTKPIRWYRRLWSCVVSLVRRLL